MFGFVYRRRGAGSPRAWRGHCSRAGKENLMRRYEAKQFPRLKGLSGISDALLQDHLKLYEGYVKNSNQIIEELEGMARAGKASGTNLAYAELTRRLGFETDGVILHELYFANMASEPEALAKDSPLGRALAQSFGSIDAWLTEFKAIAAMRGVGWAVAFQDPATKEITNRWIELHNDGHPAGYRPIVVMDCWEHAFIPDYKPTERAKYIDAYLRNLDYRACADRLIK
jgi:superoxide dismutase, Fe-Mn family